LSYKIKLAAFRTIPSFVKQLGLIQYASMTATLIVLLLANADVSDKNAIQV